jgi:hypothetical protein
MQRITKNFSFLMLPQVFLILSLFLIVIAAYNTKVQLDGHSKDLHQLNSDIANANQYLRQASIAPTAELIETELAKMKVTRGSADSVYSRLIASVQLSQEDNAVVSTLILERETYRQFQMKAVQRIREQSTKQIIWDAVIPYQALQIKYVTRVNGLIRAMDYHLQELYKYTLIKIIVIFLVFFLYNALSIGYLDIRFKK